MNKQILIFTLGTRGDFEPFLLLARALSRRGCRVTLASSPFHLEGLREDGFDLAPLGNSTRAELNHVLESLADIHGGQERTRHYVQRWLRPQLAASMPRIVELAGTTDCIVNNLKLVLKRGESVIPTVAVTYDPPSEIAQLDRFPTSQFRESALELVAMNRRLVDPRIEWPARFIFTGFWHPPELAWRPPKKLVEFLQAGQAPVVLTMGSMASVDMQALLSKLSAALFGCNQRAIFVAAWSAAGNNPDARRIYMVDEVPYAWLFPRASCVIHHGGCGTVAAVIRAGKPSIVLPQVASQEQFGVMLTRECLAAGMFHASSLTVHDLAGAMEKVSCDERIKKACEAWQGFLQADGGIEQAAELIERHAATT